MEREALRPQSPADRLLRRWKSIIELVFAAMAFRFGALRYSAPKREHPPSADRSCSSVDAISIDP